MTKNGIPLFPAEDVDSDVLVPVIVLLVLGDAWIRGWIGNEGG